MSAHLELWQTEWCPASHGVRQRLTELGLSYVVRQVPVEREERTELFAATGATEIPVLVLDGRPVVGDKAIVCHPGEHYEEPAGAPAQRAKAAKITRKGLDDACPKLAAAAH